MTPLSGVPVAKPPKCCPITGCGSTLCPGPRSLCCDSSNLGAGIFDLDPESQGLDKNNTKQYVALPAIDKVVSPTIFRYLQQEKHCCCIIVLAFIITYFIMYQFNLFM